MRRFTRSSRNAATNATTTTTTTTPQQQSPRRSNRSLPSKSSPPSPPSPPLPSSQKFSNSSSLVTPSPRKRERAKSPRPTKQPPSLTRESIRKMVVSRVLRVNDGKPLETDGTQRHSQPQTDSSGTVLIDTQTMGKWCLVDGLVHCATASDGILAPLILEHGPPLFYLDYLREKQQQQQRSCENDTPKGYLSFRSLCRTVAGQQLAGAAAETIWRRLVEVVIGSSTRTAKEATNPTESFSTSPLSSSLHSFTPDAVLAVVESDRNNSSDETDHTDKLRKPAGLSRAKCGCILAIAQSYRDGSLSESFLTTGTDEEVRSRLLAIKGLGPWSVDMFLMFRCHRSNILPVGDLALRNGTAALWKVRGSGKKHQRLCAKQDAALIEQLHAPFAPYRSLSSYYMYKVADACKPSKKKKKR